MDKPRSTLTCTTLAMGRYTAPKSIEKDRDHCTAQDDERTADEHQQPDDCRYPEG